MTKRQKLENDEQYRNPRQRRRRVKEIIQMSRRKIKSETNMHETRRSVKLAPVTRRITAKRLREGKKGSW